MEAFLRKVVIEEIKGIQDKGYHYISFGLIAQGIETLGAAMDSQPISQGGLSQVRFENAIEQLFPAPYLPFKTELYKKLRCGLLHVFLPARGIELIEAKDISKFGEHLDKKKIRNGDTFDSLIIVSKSFCEDLINATLKLINESKIHPSKRTHRIIHDENLIPPTPPTI